MTKCSNMLNADSDHYYYYYAISHFAIELSTLYMSQPQVLIYCYCIFREIIDLP